MTNWSTDRFLMLRYLKELIVIVAGGTNEAMIYSEGSLIDVSGGTLSSTEILSNGVWTFGEHHEVEMLI